MNTRPRSVRLLALSALPALLAALALLPVVLLGGSTPAGAEARLASQPAYDPDGPLVLRVYFRGEAERIAISREYGHEALPTPGGYLLILADRSAYDSLRARGLRVDIDADATRQAQQPIPFGGSGDTFFYGYHTVEEMEAFLDAKVAGRPTLAQKVDIGDSWCKTHPGQCTQPNSYNGYDIWAMRVTNQAVGGPKPVFWFNAGLHSRELVPPELAMLYISWLLDGYDTNADARWLVDHHEIWIVPMSNPDGHHIVENGNSPPRTQRKNADKDDNCTTWPPNSSNQFGTDLNRNFPFMWGCCGGSQGAPCALTYRGPAEGSEEETQAITAKVRELIPDQRGPALQDAAPITTTGVFVDMHSYAALNLYPFGQQFNPGPNDADLRNIAKHLNSPQTGGNGYETKQSSYLYLTDGASDDWAYGERGPAAFTVELLSSNTFFPPTTTIGIDWNANRGMLIHLSKIARAPYLLTRGPDTNNVVSMPMTVTQGTPAALTASINYNWSSNDPVEPNTYLQNVAAAEYYVDTPPWAGGTPLPMQAADGTFDSPTEAVQVSVPTGSLAPGRHLLLVRGRGVNDYEGHQSWGTLSAAFLDVLPPSGATVTPTPIAPSPTPTFILPPCGVLPQPASTTCEAPSSYNYSFGFYNESGCQNTATGTATLTFDAATDPGGPFTVYETFTRTVTFPPGPSYVTFTGTLTIDNIPAQYTHYRISFSASSVRPNAYSLTPANAICRVAGPTVTPTLTPSATPTVTSTVTPTITPTACTLEFADVPPTNTFYPFVRCLACQGIISGYP
ncbi:MAG TPA: M14 family zinc carboxypeptidase [Chloroflexia bacterium]|nr:M14 family zinc carboxypeptidase [Chloroflexia bacterium]